MPGKSKRRNVLNPPKNVNGIYTQFHVIFFVNSNNVIISQYYVSVSLTSYFFQCSDSLSPTNRPDMTDTLLKRTKNCKLSIYPSIL